MKSLTHPTLSRTNPTTRNLVATLCGSALLALAPATQAQFDTILNIPTDPDIPGSSTIGITGVDDTQVNVFAGGAIGSFVTLSGGSEVNLDGGTIGSTFTAESGSTFNVISGTYGVISVSTNIESGATLNQSGGTQAGILNIYGTANVTGGTLGTVDVETGGVATFTNATIGSSLDTFAGSTSIFNNGTYGSSYDFNGTVTINGGTFAGGHDFDSVVAVINDGTFGTVDLEAGSDVTINGGTFASSFDANAGTAVINGGTFGSNADFFSDLTINGGTFASGADFGANGGSSTINVTGGIFEGLVDSDGGTINISGGTFGGEYDIFNGSVTNISGGDFTGGSNFDVSNGTVNISGGLFGSDFDIFAAGIVNLIGVNFYLDGVLITGSIGDVITITDRDVALTGTLEDGTFFDIDLESVTNLAGADFVATDATLTVTLVPEPGSLALLSFAGMGLLARRRRG